MKSNNLNIHTSSVYYVRPNVIRRFVHPYIVISNSGGLYVIEISKVSHSSLLNEKRPLSQIYNLFS